MPRERDAERAGGTGRVIKVACWAEQPKVPAMRSIVGKAAEGHFRRGIFDKHRGQPTVLSIDLLERIGQLYAVEASVRGRPPVRMRILAGGRLGLATPVRGALREVTLGARGTTA